MLRNSETRYGLVARAFHWSVAGLIVGMIGLGWYMVGLTYYDPLYHDSLAVHKALGMVVLILVVLRLVWMLAGPRPLPAPSLTCLERMISRIVHDLLRLAMVVIPVSGYLVSTSQGDPVSVFGLIEVPAVTPVSDAWVEAIAAVHFYAAYGTAALIVLHVAGALKHRVLDHDEVMGRML